MKKYHQLTVSERYTIKSLKKIGLGNKEIGEFIGKHAGTISREFRRNGLREGYFPKLAQCLAEKRKYRKGRVKFSEEIKGVVEDKLKEKWSPDQICKWLKLHKLPWVSHERIYQYVAQDKKSGGELYKHLRWGHKKYKKRYGSRENRGQIRNRVLIDERPDIINRRERIGDWEGDTMHGKKGGGVLVTLVERVSKFTLIGAEVSREARVINRTIRNMVAPYKEKILSLTLDNGKEFAFHENLSKRLDTDIYFSHPYHAWERGLNENTNGLIRQFFPKRTDLRKVSVEEVLRAQNLLNRRPRKALGYKTPYEVFIEGKEILKEEQKVALAT